MAEQPTSQPSSPVRDAESLFANAVLGDWRDAMDLFFARVESKRIERGLTVAQVSVALGRGYGDEVADEWEEWADG